MLTWYRLKSDDQHVIVKMDPVGYLEDQPETVLEAQALADELLQATAELREICHTDKRTVILKLNVSDMNPSRVNVMSTCSFMYKALSQDLDISRVELKNCADWFSIFTSLLPKHVRDVIVFI